MKIPEIDTVCFVGAGTMGCANSLAAAVAGYTAVVYDLAQETLDQVAPRQQEMAAYMVGAGLCAAEDIPVALQRISVTSDLEKAVASADLVSESVYERLDIKREIHRKLDRILPPGAILTTNSSALTVSEIEDVVQRGELFAALHSHLGSPLYDIVSGPRTAPETIALLRRYVLSLGGFPLVLKKEHPAYVFNAMLGPVLTMAMMLVIEGAAEQEAVDRAWMVEHDTAIGPFGLMDLFGLDIAADNWQHPKPIPDFDALQAKILPYLTSYVEDGKLGVKTGAGFYSYPGPVFQAADFLKQEAVDATVRDALNSSLIEAAVRLAQLGVADWQDIDRAWMVAMGLGIGPFGMLDNIGIDDFLTLFKTQVVLDLFSPDSVGQVAAFLAPYIERGALGQKTGEGFYHYPDPAWQQVDFLRPA